MLSTRFILSHLLKSRTAISTVLGMLIFVGILFTCVMPFFLYINQVNSLYERKIIEMKQFDQERSLEKLDVYAYPLNQSSNQISLYIKNRSPFTVEIVRVWINDQYIPYSIRILGTNECTTEPIDVQDILPHDDVESFYIKVTTARGNMFSSQTNPLQYSSDYGWSGGHSFAINIVVEMDTGVYNFIISVTSSNGTTIYDEDVWVLHSVSLMRKISVSGPDTYHIRVVQTMGIDRTCERDVQITLEEPTKWVYMDYPEDFQ